MLTARELNRTTLARQLLLERADLGVVDAVTHLVGLQAQVPGDPYVAMWSRLERFDPNDLSARIEDRSLVRIVVMRGTIHLVTAADCLAMRPLFEPVLDGELVRHSEHKDALRDLDVAPVLAFARPLLSERALTGTELRAELAQAFPHLDAPALAYACRNHLALVQVPPRGLWNRSGQVRTMTAEGWLGKRVTTRPSVSTMVTRYLATFGPATVADIAAWSRLTGLREVVERLRPKLRTVQDERGRELFDVPDAPHVDADVPAPPRFLPEYDNALLSHADRSRFVRDEDRAVLSAAKGPVKGTLLVEGTVRGVWHLEREKAVTSLVVEHTRTFPKRVSSAVGAEGSRLLELLTPDGGRGSVRLLPISG